MSILSSLGILNHVRDTYTAGETLGKYYINGEFICEVIERPWKDNIPYESCIPEGAYRLKLRSSNVVKRSTGGEFTEGYEVTDVPDRTWIMLHPANKASSLHGCQAPGKTRGMIDGDKAVFNSRDAFRDLMSRLEERNEWELVISKDPYYDHRR